MVNRPFVRRAPRVDFVVVDLRAASGSPGRPAGWTRHPRDSRRGFPPRIAKRNVGRLIEQQGNIIFGVLTTTTASVPVVAYTVCGPGPLTKRLDVSSVPRAVALWSSRPVCFGATRNKNKKSTRLYLRHHASRTEKRNKKQKQEPESSQRLEAKHRRGKTERK
jgi:hypothetical protein